MNAATMLLTTQGQLVAHVQGQPAAALACAFSWLDPLHLLDIEPDEGDDLDYALRVCRGCFPAIYATTLQAMGQGIAGERLEYLLLDALNPQLPAPVTTLEDLRYGVPFEALGVDYLDSVEFADSYPRLAAVATWMVGEAQPLSSDAASAMITPLLASLLSGGEAGDQGDLANLLRWLGGTSGNTLIDFTLDDLYDNGLDLPDWQPEEIAFLNDCQEEAYAILESALRGLDKLETDVGWRAQFQRNCAAVRALQGKKVCDDLTWAAGAVDGADDAADAAA